MGNCRTAHPAWLGIGLTVLSVSTARADPPEPPAAADIDTEVAQEHFAAGARAYLGNDYARALAEFEAARSARPLPDLEFNVARCLDRLQRYPEALAAYQRYLAAVDPARDPNGVAEARQRISRLQERAAAAPPAQAEVRTRPAPPERPLGRRPLFWVAVGAAAVLIAGGIALAVTLSAQPSDPIPSLGHMSFGLR